MGLRKDISLGLEISQEYISLVELESRGKEIKLKKYEKMDTPPLLINPSLNAENISDADKFKESIRNLFDKASLRGKKISLAIPDGSVKVAFLEFEDIPNVREKVAELIKWHLKKTLPFPTDEAVVDFQILDTPRGQADPPQADGVKDYGNTAASIRAATRLPQSKFYRLIAVLMKKTVLNNYEVLFNACGLFPRIIIPSSLAVYNLYHDRLIQTPLCALLTASKKRIHIVILKNGKPCFHRTKEIEGEKEGLREIFSSFNYYHDSYEDMPARIYVLDLGFESMSFKADMEDHFKGIDILPINLSDMITVIQRSQKSHSRSQQVNENIFSGAAGAALRM